MEAKQVVCTAPMTSFMLDHLGKVVGDGLRTSAGFKKCQLARCATAMNEHFQLNLTHANVGNHNRTWRRKWETIIRLRGLSGALWDDENSMIVLDHGHYTNHIKDHKEDEPFLNKPLKHYNLMAIIHGNTIATSQYTKGSNDPLATEVKDISDNEAYPLEEGSNSSNGGDSVAPNPKRAKTKSSVDEGLQSTLMAAGERLAIAIERSVSTDNSFTSIFMNNSMNNSMVGLWEGMKDIPFFGIDYLAHYFAYLVENPNIAMAFQLLEKDQKSIWVARYVKNTFPPMDG
ncbi:hypothetical protein VPH35_137564 [Triticum aestivum]